MLLRTMNRDLGLLLIRKSHCTAHHLIVEIMSHVNERILQLDTSNVSAMQGLSSWMIIVHLQSSSTDDSKSILIWELLPSFFFLLSTASFASRKSFSSTFPPFSIVPQKTTPVDRGSDAVPKI
mmetsp:Transcript_23017/g.41307  ORF Transcript_23017/g.41307 Transcript_23017/m.41307 type:complete len:123 (-) Transcript_23017:743-1111(-)